MIRLVLSLILALTLPEGVVCQELYRLTAREGQGERLWNASRDMYVIGDISPLSGCNVYGSDHVIRFRIQYPDSILLAANPEAIGFIHDTLLVVLDNRENVYVFDIATSRIVHERKNVAFVKVDSTGYLMYQQLTGGGSPGFTLYVWDLDADKTSAVLDRLSEKTICHRDGNPFAVIHDRDGNATVYRFPSFDKVRDMKLHGLINTAGGVCFLSDGRRGLAGVRRYELNVFDIESGTIESSIEEGSSFRNIYLSPDDQHTILTDGFNAVLRNLTTGSRFTFSCSGVSDWSPAEQTICLTNSAQTQECTFPEMVPISTVSAWGITNRPHVLCSSNVLVVNPTLMPSTRITISDDMASSIFPKEGHYLGLNLRYRILGTDFITDGIGSEGWFDVCDTPRRVTMEGGLMDGYSYLTRDGRYLIMPDGYFNRGKIVDQFEGRGQTYTLPIGSILCGRPFGLDSTFIWFGSTGSAMVTFSGRVIQNINVSIPFAWPRDEDLLDISGTRCLLPSEDLRRLRFYNDFPKTSVPRILAVDEGQDSVRFLAGGVSQNGRLYYTGQSNGRVRIYDAETHAVVADTTLGGYHDRGIRGAFLKYDFTTSVLSGIDHFGEVFVVRWASQATTSIAEKPLHLDHPQMFTSVIDGRLSVVASEPLQDLSLFDIQGRSIIAHHSDTPSALSLFLDLPQRVIPSVLFVRVVTATGTVLIEKVLVD